MKHTLLSLIAITSLPVFAQNREADVLSPLDFINSTQSPSNQNDDFDALVSIMASSNTPVDTGKTQQSQKAGDSALDFILGGPENTSTDDGILSVVGLLGGGPGAPSSPLDYVYAPYSTSSGLGVLSAITGAYAVNSFHSTGVWLSPTGTMSGSTGYYGSPEWGRITSGFGYRSRFKRMHKGIDIAMAVGDTVRVVRDGTIDKVAYEARGYGHYIVVRHADGMETRYAHLSQPLVAVGQRVMTDEPIALSGNTGNSTGPHLHFETRFNGSAVDPTSVFDFTGSGAHSSGYADNGYLGGGNYFDNSYAKAYDGYVTTHTPAPAEMATGFNATKRSLTDKRTYIVREGDTLQRIAERAGISVMKLCQLNGILDNELPATGTMLRLR